MSEFFTIYLNGLDHNVSFSNFKNELIEKFNARNGSIYKSYEINNELFPLFVERYFPDSRIRWEDLFRNQNIPWTHHLLTKYNKFVDWDLVVKNKKIVWSIEFIKNNYKYIKFNDFFENIEFLWDKTNISNLKEFVEFTNNGKTRGNFITSYNYEYLFNKFNFKNSLSLTNKIDWNEDIIDFFIDDWDWGELSANRNIFWSKKLIEKYETRINFATLSLNENVEWTKNLIEKYQDKLNWFIISGNRKIPWTSDFIIKNSSRLNFKYNDLCYHNSTLLSNCNLSTNSEIIWTLELFDLFIDRIDICEISKCAKIEVDALIKYHDKFDEEKYLFSYHARRSDWDESFDVYINNWQNLIQNPKMHTKEIKNVFFENKTFLYNRPKGNSFYYGCEIISTNVSIQELFTNGEEYILKK